MLYILAKVHFKHGTDHFQRKTDTLDSKPPTFDQLELLSVNRKILVVFLCDAALLSPWSILRCVNSVFPWEYINSSRVCMCSACMEKGRKWVVECRLTCPLRSIFKKVNNKY